MIKKLFHQINDPLYKSSLYLMLSSITAAGFGFIFWIIAARLYPPEDVGIATALISSVSLLVLLSRLGFDQSIIRFFPERNKNKVFSTSLIITTVFVILLGIIFILGIQIWSPNLAIITSIPIIYLIFLVFSSIFSLTGIAFVALRKAKFYFLQNLLNCSRIIFLFPLVFLGAIGIFSSVGISVIITSLLPLYFLYRFKIRLSGIDVEYLKESFNFSIGNYFSGFFLTAPNMILPIMVFNLLGAEKAAYYYISYAITSLLFLIPAAFGMSLFVEGSHGESLKRISKKSIIAIFFILVPAVFFVFFFGDYLLMLLGKSYIQGFDLLRIMIFSSIFFSIVQMYISIKKAQKDIQKLIIVSGLNFILILGLSYGWLLSYGLVGMGYAWIIAYGLTTIIIGGLIKLEKWI